MTDHTIAIIVAGAMCMLSGILFTIAIMWGIGKRKNV